MKVGSLVKADYSEAVGIVIDLIQKKVWRTDKLGPMIDWRKIDPEPHAVVLYAHNDGTVDIPVIDLTLIKNLN